MGPGTAGWAGPPRPFPGLHHKRQCGSHCPQRPSTTHGPATHLPGAPAGWRPPPASGHLAPSLPLSFPDHRLSTHLPVTLSVTCPSICSVFSGNMPRARKFVRCWVGAGRAPNSASVFPPTRSGGAFWALGLRGSTAVRELLGAVKERGLGAPTPLHLPSPRGGRGSPFPPAVRGPSSALAMEGSAVNQTDPSWRVWEWRGRVGGPGARGPRVRGRGREGAGGCPGRGPCSHSMVPSRLDFLGSFQSCFALVFNVFYLFL